MCTSNTTRQSSLPVCSTWHIWAISQGCHSWPNQFSIDLQQATTGKDLRYYPLTLAAPEGHTKMTPAYCNSPQIISLPRFVMILDKHTSMLWYLPRNEIKSNCFVTWYYFIHTLHKRHKVCLLFTFLSTWWHHNKGKKGYQEHSISKHLAVCQNTFDITLWCRRKNIVMLYHLTYYMSWQDNNHFPVSYRKCNTGLKPITTIYINRQMVTNGHIDLLIFSPPLTLQQLGNFFQNAILFCNISPNTCYIYVWNWSNLMNI